MAAGYARRQAGSPLPPPAQKNSLGADVTHLTREKLQVTGQSEETSGSPKTDVCVRASEAARA